jgi:acyl carrier protein
VDPNALAVLMQELLETDDILVDDNFFDMGGTSVLALRLLLELDKRYGRTLSLLDVMHNPTPQGLARKLDESPQPAGADPAATAGSAE